jgi:hypothetical protein
MKLKKKLIVTLLGGAMLALPVAVPALAQTSYNSNYIQPVDDWWWDHYRNDREGYASHGWHEGYYEYGGRKTPCERARGLQAEVWRDRNTGHPAAARDIQEEADAARSACYSR